MTITDMQIKHLKKAQQNYTKRPGLAKSPDYKILIF